MHVLKDAFYMLSWSGVWRPINMTSKKQITLYNIFSFASILAQILLLLLQFMTLCFGNLPFDDFSEIFYTFITVILDTCRALNFLLNRERLIELTNMLRKSSCQPMTKNEISIKCSADDFIRQVTIGFNIIIIFTVAGYVLKVFILSNDGYALPDGILTPYDLQSPRNFWLTFIFETITYMACGFVNINECCIVSGLMIYACVQFDILALRLQELTDKVERAGPEFYSTQVQQLTVKNIIRQHLHVVEYSKKITEAFYWTMIVQLVVVSIIVSMIVSSLVVKQPGVTDICVYICCLIILTATFFSYCWFGNEISLKSQDFTDSVYNTDWLVLSIESKKMLLLVMQQSTKPLVLGSGYLVSLDLNTFKKIMKLTYSAFNFFRSST